MRSYAYLIAAVISFAPATSFAEGAATGYLWKGGEDTAGLGASGWLAIGNSPVFVTGKLQAGKVAFAPAIVPPGFVFSPDYDYNEARAGGGLAARLGKTAAVWAGGQVIRIDVESVDDIGLGLFAGATFSPAELLWLNAEFGIVDAGDFGEASEFALNASYSLSKSLSVSVGRHEEIVTGATTRAGVQFNF